MAGFTETQYDSGQGVTMLLRMSDAEFAAITASTTAADFEAHAYSSGSRRRFGVHARGVNLTIERGTAPDTFNDTKFLAIPTIAEYDAATTTTTFDISGETWTVTKKIPEVAA